MTQQETCDAPLCARCSTLGKTCCQTTEIYVTPGDIRRIASQVGGRDFFEYRSPEDPAYLDQSHDPVWAAHVFRSNGTRRVLRRDTQSNCRFLGANGCHLSMEVRPLICRLYPYQYTAAGLEQELAPGCPLKLLPMDHTLEQELNMSRQIAGEWHSLLYAEIRKETDNDCWTDL
ncbi:MAG: YkgJ family cysteine cluster protein [Pseudomonadota bacterium]